MFSLPSRPRYHQSLLFLLTVNINYLLKKCSTCSPKEWCVFNKFSQNLLVIVRMYGNMEVKIFLINSDNGEVGLLFYFEIHVYGDQFSPKTPKTNFLPVAFVYIENNGKMFVRCRYILP